MQQDFELFSLKNQRLKKLVKENEVIFTRKSCQNIKKNDFYYFGKIDLAY